MTKKQQELIDLLDSIVKCRLSGMSNKEISEELGLTMKTLERHITKLKKRGATLDFGIPLKKRPFKQVCVT